jgi:hypothetical protein
MQRMRAGGEVVKRLTGRVHLIIMPPVREGEQLVQPAG